MTYSQETLTAPVIETLIIVIIFRNREVGDAV
jgi:hypothetical protein